MNRSDVISLVNKRFELLEQIQAGANDKRDLTDDLAITRPTVDRSIRKLEAMGLLKNTHPVGELTAYGNAMLTAHREYRERVTTLSDSKGFLDMCPPDIEIPLEALGDASVITSTKFEPRKAVSALLPYLNRASSVELVLPVLSPPLIDAIAQQSVDEELSGSVYIPAELAAYSAEQGHSPFDAISESPSVHLSVYDNSPGCACANFPECTWLGMTSRSKIEHSMVSSAESVNTAVSDLIAALDSSDTD